MQHAAHESSLRGVGFPPTFSAVCGVMGRVEGVWVVGLGDAGLDDIWVIGNAVGNANVAIDIFFPSVRSIVALEFLSMVRRIQKGKYWYK